MTTAKLIGLKRSSDLFVSNRPIAYLYLQSLLPASISLPKVELM